MDNITSTASNSCLSEENDITLSFPDVDATSSISEDLIHTTVHSENVFETDLVQTDDAIENISILKSSNSDDCKAAFEAALAKAEEEIGNIPVIKPSQIFTQVTATLSNVLVKLIPGDTNTFFQKLQMETEVFFENHSDLGHYAVRGNLKQVLNAQRQLEKFITGLRKPLSELQNVSSSDWLTGPTLDKSVMCDIIKSDHLTRFALEHPRQARFSSLVYQRSPSPTRRIKEKYRVKRRCGRPRKVLVTSVSKLSVPSKQTKLTNEECSAEREKENGLNNTSLSAEENDNSDTDQGDNENVEPKNNSDNIFPEKQKPRKNYEELTPFKFFCGMCSFKTKRESHYRKHLAIHKKVSTLYKCDQCTFTSIRLSHLRRHEMTHSQTTFSCEQCSYITDDMKLLVRHVKIKHERDEDPKPRTLLQCPECPYKTTKPYHFQRHLKVHNGMLKGSGRVYQCDQCSYKTNRKEHFIRHVNNVHSNKRPYLCDFCGKAFKRPDALKQHRVTHASVEPQGVQFRCSVCEKGCRSHAHLMEHQAVHSNVRSFLCEICGASFKTRSVQRKHVMTIHKNPRAYLCEHCDKRFNTNYALRRHLRLHTPGGEESESPPPVPASESSTNTPAISHQSVLLVPASATSVTTGLQVPSSEISISNATAIPITIHSEYGTGQTHIQLTAPVLQTADLSGTSSEAATLVPIQDSFEQVNGDGLHQQTRAFIQTGEATTALLYLTTNFAHF